MEDAFRTCLIIYLNQTGETPVYITCNKTLLYLSLQKHDDEIYI